MSGPKRAAPGMRGKAAEAGDAGLALLLGSIPIVPQRLGASLASTLAKIFLAARPASI